MSENDSIASKLDPAFIELMIKELAGQSRVAATSDHGSPRSSEAEPPDESFEAMVLGESDVRANDATPLEPLPAISDEAPEEQPAPPRQERPSEDSTAETKILLLITEPQLRERVFRLHRKPVVIGRSRECDIMIKDQKASRQHARVEQMEGRIMVEDLGSQNGTRVNGQLIRRPYEVISGDQITIGRTVVRVRRTKE